MNSDHDFPCNERPPPAEVSGPGALDAHIEQLLVAVEQVLREEPAGLSELSLIRRLQGAPWHIIGPVQFHDPATLYPVHFLLFHVLYRLRDQLAADGLTLSISPLAIRLEQSDIVAGNGLPDAEDKLRAFYLNLAEYNLPEEEILRMLDDFWAGNSGSGPDARELREASAMLGFPDVPEHFSDIKREFRRAVMQAHPDRGGDTGKIQALNQAFSVLKTHFRQARP